MGFALVVLVPHPRVSPAACRGLVGWQAPGLGETGEAVVPRDSLGLILALPLSHWPWAPGRDDPSLSRLRQDRLPDRIISPPFFDLAGLEILGMTLCVSPWGLGQGLEAVGGLHYNCSGPVSLARTSALPCLRAGGWCANPGLNRGTWVLASTRTAVFCPSSPHCDWHIVGIPSTRAVER